MRKIFKYFLLFLISACTNQKILSKNCIVIYSKYSIKDVSGKILIKDSVGYPMLLFNDSILCRMETIVDKITNNEVKQSSKKMGYLCFGANSKTGEYIQSDDSLRKQVNVKIDSVFSFYTSTLNQNFYEPIKNGNLKLIESIYNEHGLIKKYSFYDSVQKSSGEWHLFFSEKYKNLPFSMSKQLDSINKMKFFKLRILVFNDFSDQKNNSVIEIGFQKSNDSIKREMIKWQGIHYRINNNQ
jgi:hypothetical protein